MSGPTLRFEAGAVDQEFLLRHGRQVIGRGHDLEVDLHLEADWVGARHAELRWHDGILTITDLNSRAGTKVNGEKISRPTVLLDGDTLGIGSAELGVEISPEVWMDEVVDDADGESPPRQDQGSGNGSSGSAPARVGSDRDDPGVAGTGTGTGSWITGGVAPVESGSSDGRPGGPVEAGAGPDRPQGLGRVLIIRHHRDGALVSHLHRSLDRAGWDPWLVDAEILGGAEWANQTIDGLDDSTAAVVVLTNRSARSQWVEQQVAQSVRAGVPLLAVVVAGAQPSEIMGIDLGSAPQVEVESAIEPDLAAVDAALRRLALGPLARHSITSRHIGWGLVAGGAIGALLALVILAMGGRPASEASAPAPTSGSIELSATPASVAGGAGRASTGDGHRADREEAVQSTGGGTEAPTEASGSTTEDPESPATVSELTAGGNPDEMTPTRSLVRSVGFPLLAASVIAAAVGQALRRGMFSSGSGPTRS